MVDSWHDVQTGEKAPHIVNVIIEIPKDSKLKYEYNKETKLLRLDRFLFSAVHYPGDYGFVPQTLWEDGDPLDIIIITNRSIAYPLTLAEARVIGVARMIDNGERDDKIIAVYHADPRYAEYQDLTDIPKHYLEELKTFFENYKHLEGKQCKIMEFLPRGAALKDVELAQELYQKKYGKKK
jgi:inorganic pyrophosphatase